MSCKAHGQLRRSQVITTWGPGALIDLPNHAGIVGGLDTWPKPSALEEMSEPRLARKLQQLTGIVSPRLYNPPAASSDPREQNIGVGVWRFPEWFVVQEPPSAAGRERSRRLVHRKALERNRFEGRPVVPTRFVRACPRGHVDDLDWRGFVHGTEGGCHQQLWLDERGTGGDLADLVVRCECKKQRQIFEATLRDQNALGFCRGMRPWLGLNTREDCDQPSRLLIRTASNAYFPQVLSVLSLPDRGSAVQRAVTSVWDDLEIVDDAAGLAFIKKKPRVADALAPFPDVEVLAAIQERKTGGASERPVKEVELDAILAAPEGFGDDVPIEEDFHARKLPETTWRRASSCEGVEAVIQLHRLREVLALTGFTRFEAVTPDINGEYETDVERAELALDPQWFPAVENRGEGIFVQLRAEAVRGWLAREPVKKRLDELAKGHAAWLDQRKGKSKREFPGGPYLLLHTLSHLLIQSLAMRCGYPARSIRERIYVDPLKGRYGLLLYTGTPDADGTLGGLVQQARHIAEHLAAAQRMGALCSNDPICAQHEPAESFEDRLLHGAACHGCALIAETSCEMRNDYLDRALVVPTIGVADAAFFQVGR